VLGRTGRNFAAGMSGGVAYVLDIDGKFAQRCNTGMVALEEVVDSADIANLKEIVEEHYNFTASSRARMILDAWDEWLPRFIKVMPEEYRRVLEERRRREAEGDVVAAS
jgi:glutamate synthase domain-containing protein 3